MEKNKAQEQLKVTENSLIQKVDGEFHVRDEGVIQAFYSEKEAQEYIDYFNLKSC